MADVNKQFSKPADYKAVLDSLARRNIFAITSFIFGMDNDTTGVANRTVAEIESWAPGLPVFGQLTPFPSTPLYTRLQEAGRLHRPKHWLEFAPFVMAHNPLKMTIEDAKSETFDAWSRSYSPERTPRRSKRSKPQRSNAHRPSGRPSLFPRDLFPQMSKMAWANCCTRTQADTEPHKEGVKLA